MGEVVRYACLLLLGTPGVMAAGLDADLMGVIIAASVIGFLLLVIVFVVSIYCFRRIERKREKYEENRKHANDLLANGHVGNGFLPSTRPAFEYQPPRPVFYQSPPVFYTSLPPMRLAAYRPKILDGELIPTPHQELSVSMEEDKTSIQAPPVKANKEQRSRSVDANTRVADTRQTAVGNGQVVQDLSAANYRVIRKSQKVPDWLRRRSYSEHGVTMDIDDEGSDKVSRSSKEHITSNQSAATFANVTSTHSSVAQPNPTPNYTRQMSDDEYTIVDYVQDNRGPSYVHQSSSPHYPQPIRSNISETDAPIPPPLPPPPPMPDEAATTTPSSYKIVPTGTGNIVHVHEPTTVTSAATANASERVHMDLHRQRLPRDGSVGILPPPDYPDDTPM